MVWKDVGVGGEVEVAGGHSGSILEHMPVEYAGKSVQVVGLKGVGGEAEPRDEGQLEGICCGAVHHEPH